MRIRSLLPSLLAAALLLPGGLAAESKKTAADRALAKELSASLVLVASEASKFADVRDQLAKTRLAIMQGLERNTIWIQEGNDFDQRAWKVVGEDYRIDLFQGVLDATTDIAARREAAVAREAANRQQLASTRSAVARKSTELTSAAASLAALAEPPISGQAVSALIQGTLSDLSSALATESPKLAQGLDLASEVAGAVESRLGGTPPPGQ